MNKNENNKEKSNNGPTFYMFKEKNNLTKLNIQKTYVYGDKTDCLYEDIFFKQNETFNPKYFTQNKSSVDLNLTDNKLHQLLNKDLIKALDNDSIEPQENYKDESNSNINSFILGNSEFNSHPLELNNPLVKNANDNNINSNKTGDFKNNNFNNNNNNNLSMNLNIDNYKAENRNMNEEYINNINKMFKDNRNINDNIDILNNPLLAPIFIPKKAHYNMEKIEDRKEMENNDNLEKKKERKKNLLTNKFDDNVDSIIMLSKVSKEEKTKLPLEIRAGDWICLYCNNLNFAFRIKCNRCGILRKNTIYKKRKITIITNTIVLEMKIKGMIMLK